LERTALSRVLREDARCLTLQFQATFGGIYGWAVRFERAALGRVIPDGLTTLLGSTDCVCPRA
jgi:hypothetical protein